MEVKAAARRIIERIIRPAEPDLVDVDQAPWVVGEPDPAMIVAGVARADAVLALDRKAIALTEQGAFSSRPPLTAHPPFAY
jgi:hypothetical protein